MRLARDQSSGRALLEAAGCSFQRCHAVRCVHRKTPVIADSQSLDDTGEAQHSLIMLLCSSLPPWECQAVVRFMSAYTGDKPTGHLHSARTLHLEKATPLQFTVFWHLQQPRALRMPASSAVQTAKPRAFFFGLSSTRRKARGPPAGLSFRATFQRLCCSARRSVWEGARGASQELRCKCGRPPRECARAARWRPRLDLFESHEF